MQRPCFLQWRYSSWLQLTISGSEIRTKLCCSCLSTLVLYKVHLLAALWASISTGRSYPPFCWISVLRAVCAFSLPSHAKPLHGWAHLLPESCSLLTFTCNSLCLQERSQMCPLATNKASYTGPIRDTKLDWSLHWDVFQWEKDFSFLPRWQKQQLVKMRQMLVRDEVWRKCRLTPLFHWEQFSHI